MSSTIPPFLTPIQRLDTYFNTSKPLKSFTDADIENIATLLQRAGNPAHRTPRIYIILRVIDELPLLTQLIQTGFSDSWFPVSERQLPNFLPQPTKTKITATQQIILTPSLDLENGKHCHFSSSSSEELPFSVLSCLGRGAYGQVDCIESKTSHKLYALKRIHRRTAFGKNAKQAMQDFQNEMLIMKTLHHKHTIRYVGSYTDLQNLGVLMSPVARCDLSRYMQHASRSRNRTPTDSEYPLQLLSTFMGCLATALRYLHVNDVKHRDIKPQNILVDNDDNVLIADFGLSRDFLDTTSGLTPASPRYCAPEVAAYEPRNMSADIWSLGCVFFEMLAALRGFDGEWLTAYFRGVGSGSAKYHANTQATETLLRQWEQEQDCGERETRPVGWIRRMLVVERRERASAGEVLDMILRPVEGCSPKMFCGECCILDGNSV